MGRATTCCALVGALLLITEPAGATPGVTQDPDDASFKIDIRAIYHHDDDSSVTYYMQSWSDFDDTGWFCAFGWDFDENGTRDGAAFASLEYGPSGYVATQTADGGEEQVAEAAVSRTAVGAPHSAPDSTPQNTIKIVVAKSAMEEAGMGAGDSGYRYSVGCGEPDRDWESGQYGDSAPDNWEDFPIAHSFGGSASPPAATPIPATAQPEELEGATGSSGSNVVPIAGGLALLGALVAVGALVLARRRAG